MIARRLLDTSVAIALRDGDRRIAERVSEPHSLLISAVTLVELEGGVHRDPSQTARRRDRLETLLSVMEILPFTEEAARAYGSIVEQVGFSRPRVLDRMIAAAAIVAGASLATLNPRDFTDIPNLELEDWSA